MLIKTMYSNCNLLPFWSGFPSFRHGAHGYISRDLLMDGLFSDVATPGESFDVLQTWPQVLFALRRDPPCLLWGSMRASPRKLNYLYDSDSISRIIARQDQDVLVQEEPTNLLQTTDTARAPRMPSTALPRTTPSRVQMDGAPPRVQSALPRSASTRRVLPAGAPASTSSPRAMPAYRRLGVSRAVVPRGLGRPAPTPSRMSAVDVLSSAAPTAVARIRAGAHAISPLALPCPTGCPTRTPPLLRTADVRSSAPLTRARADANSGRAHPQASSSCALGLGVRVRARAR
ncbi:hypothetical protein B0H10DRAFT_941923 [Mycena sp. CBHHK59/15]|nr:hypothetical protein B0H10DRAFT_941923 [Mycena sp. CBHHK59/15]